MLARIFHQTGPKIIVRGMDNAHLTDRAIIQFLPLAFAGADRQFTVVLHAPLRANKPGYRLGADVIEKGLEPEPGSGFIGGRIPWRHQTG